MQGSPEVQRAGLRGVLEKRRQQVGRCLVECSTGPKLQLVDSRFEDLPSLLEQDLAVRGVGCGVLSEENDGAQELVAQLDPTWLLAESLAVEPYRFESRLPRRLRTKAGVAGSLLPGEVGTLFEVVCTSARCEPKAQEGR